MRISKNSEFNYMDMIEAIKLMGFEYLEMNFYRRVDEIGLDTSLILYCQLYDDSVKLDVYKDAEKLDTQLFKFPIKFIDYVEDILKSHNIETAVVQTLDSSDNAIFCASSRDFAEKLLRVKSSNVWSYAFQPRTETAGDMLMQFKGSNGGPGDIYIYYDVPSKLWRKFVSAPSKGHFFWQYVRNIFKYAKLTGDKRTHLPNGL